MDNLSCQYWQNFVRNILILPIKNLFLHILYTENLFLTSDAEIKIIIRNNYKKQINNMII